MVKNFQTIDEPTELLIDAFVEQFLEENYREIDGVVSDIRYKYYGDNNVFYSHNLKKEYPVETITCTLKDYTFDFISESIKNIIDAMLYCIKIENCFPDDSLFGFCCPPIDYKKTKQRLAICYDGCDINEDTIEINIRVGSTDVV